MRPPQQIMSLAKAVRKPYLAGSIICICFFLLELTAWPNMSPWSWLYLAPYCIALLLLTWFPVPASMAILVTHIACAIIPAICDGPSTLYGTWLVCGIVAFEIKRFEFAIMGPLLCALALPLGYWTGGIDYNPSIPVLACSYIGAFFVALPYGGRYRQSNGKPTWRLHKNKFDASRKDSKKFTYCTIPSQEL